MRLLAALGLLLAGAVTGLATVALHELWWGLALAVLATATTLWALPAGWWARLPFSLGWTGLVGLLVAPRREGDYVVSQDTAGYALVGLALLVLVIGIGSLPHRRSGPRRVPS